MTNLRSILALLASCTFILGGCAVYQHRVIEPAEFAGPIDRDGMSFAIEPLEYRAAEERGRLELRIFNPTNDPVTLLGERSYLIDPAGETRSLLGGTIAPGSYITVILPPEVATVRPGPRFGVGVGVGVGMGRFGVGGYHDPWRHHPSYVHANAPIWRWTTGDVRLHLVYERAGEQFAHDVHLERVKVY